jgi:hypothetical protein
MTDEELQRQVAELRAKGRSPKEIAQALGVRPAAVAALVRTIAGRDSASPHEPALVGCWVSPGWRAGLTVAEHADWPAGEAGDADAGEAGDGDGDEAGLVAVLVAREHRYDKVAVCGWLVDVYCLGVRDVLGPRAIAARELPAFVERYFDGYPAPPEPAPVELARHLVWGAVEYARGLGFEPAADFEPSTGHLGALDGSSDITFGRDGRPVFVERPRDDAASVVRTLEGSVGAGNFDVVEGAARAVRQGAARQARPGPRGGDSRRSGEAVPGSRQWRSRNR